MARPEQPLSHAVWSATLWNTLLLPARLLVGVLASVIYYQDLNRGQVGLIFFLTSLATTIGVYADLGIERTLPRFLPEVQAQAGRRGVERLIRQVVRVKLLVLLGLVLGLMVLAAPITHYLAAKQRDEAVRADRALAGMPAGPASADAAAALRVQAEQARGLAHEIEARGPVFIGAVGLLLLLGALFDVCMQFLTTYFKQRAWNVITLTSTLLQPILVTALILAGLGIEGVLLGIVITPLVGLALAGWQALRAAREIEIDPLDRPLQPGLRGRFARYAAVTYLMQISTWFYDIEVVVFLATAVLDLGQVAILGFAYKLAKDLLGYVWTPLTGVMTPLLARIKERKSDTALQEAVASLTRMIWLLVVPAGVGLLLLAPRLVHALYPTYAAGISVILVFIVFTFLESLLSVPHNVLMVHELYRPVILSRLVAFLSVPLVILALPRYGLMGVAVTVGLVRVAARVVTVVAAARRLQLGLPLRFGLRVAAASGVCALALASLLWLAPSEGPTLDAAGKLRSLLPLICLGLAGTAAYALTLRAFGGLDEAERRRLLALPLPAKGLLRQLL